MRIAFLQKLKINKEGKAPIYVAIYAKEEVELISTGERVEPSNWDKINQWITDPNQSHIAAIIAGVKLNVELCRTELKRLHGVEPSAHEVKLRYIKRQKGIRARLDEPRFTESEIMDRLHAEIKLSNSVIKRTRYSSRDWYVLGFVACALNRKTKKGTLAPLSLKSRRPRSK